MYRNPLYMFDAKPPSKCNAKSQQVHLATHGGSQVHCVACHIFKGWAVIPQPAWHGIKRHTMAVCWREYHGDETGHDVCVHCRHMSYMHMYVYSLYSCICCLSLSLSLSPCKSLCLTMYAHILNHAHTSTYHGDFASRKKKLWHLHKQCHL